MPLTNLLRSFSTEKSIGLEKPQSTIIMESLFMELEFHIRELEEQEREQEKQERRKKTGVDYSWLVTSTPKRYEISHIDRMELEEFGRQVQPVECSKVIALFRDAIAAERDYTKLAGLLKTCIKQVLEGRPKEETMSEWMHKSLVNLKKIAPSAKVTPISYESELKPSSSSSNFTADGVESLPV
ncbi:unnamed protein product [Dimorphilus gyrociliatus]|uniref:Uncharacterized protein n=1 Tax=Dimorphilus gyrociliatus TaxID=2664684 RepID=A0A7I8VSG1_9ANNE|nr:unnamed protein product [Dimorphilus gyrociliatus]